MKERKYENLSSIAMFCIIFSVISFFSGTFGGWIMYRRYSGEGDIGASLWISIAVSGIASSLIFGAIGEISRLFINIAKDVHEMKLSMNPEATKDKDPLKGKTLKDIMDSQP